MEDIYELSAVNTLQEAVNTILKFLGLSPANLSEKVNEGVHTHTLLASGKSEVSTTVEPLEIRNDSDPHRSFYAFVRKAQALVHLTLSPMLGIRSKSIALCVLSSADSRVSVTFRHASDLRRRFIGENCCLLISLFGCAAKKCFIVANVPFGGRDSDRKRGGYVIEFSCI